jgi:hypothetical protein
LGQSGFEVGDCRASAFQQSGFDMYVQHIARPAMFDSALRISEALLGIFQLRQQHQIMAPMAIVQQLVGQLLRPATPQQKRACT